MNRKRLLAPIFALMCGLLLVCSGCTAPTSETDQKQASESTSSNDSASQSPPQQRVATDYSNADNWVVRPEAANMPVDVFYLIPTVWSKASADESNICEIDNASLRATAPHVIDMQASAYETTGNIYAPYYRQADAAYCLTIPLDEQEALLSGIPKDDLFAALDYYFEHDNKGKPFILAGHSQGSDMMLFVLSEYMSEHPEYLDRMIAAYAIGYSITDEFLAENPHLSFAQGATDTGVIISYNTQAPEIEGANPVVIKGAQGINPVSWTRTEQTASAEQSLGSRIDGTDVPHFADATIDTESGVLICSTANPDDFVSASGIFGKGIYHGQDYSFYYYDIRANAEARTAAFLAEH